VLPLRTWRDIIFRLAPSFPVAFRYLCLSQRRATSASTQPCASYAIGQHTEALKVVSGEESLIEYVHKHLNSTDLRRLRPGGDGTAVSIGTQFPGLVPLFVLVVAGSRQLAAAEKQQLQQPPIASDGIAGNFASPCASSVMAICAGFN